jgi:SAM-dependent methyltransferase
MTLYMKEWYERYFVAIEHSIAYGEFCRRVFGLNLGQHGFSDMTQIQLLVDALDINSDDRLIDIGCGTGGIITGIAEDTGARAVGVDYIEYAVSVARPRFGSSRMHFVAADIGALCFDPESFDVVISIDTLYFTPLNETVACIAGLLAPQGRLGVLYSHGADPENPLPVFDRSELPPDSTPLSVALRNQGLAYSTVDVTEADYQHALLKKAVLEELHLTFIAEGNEFLFDNRYGEANGVLAAIDADAHARYLYIITKPAG